MPKFDWQRLIDCLQRGDCVPFIGSGMCSPTLPTGGELSSIWAKRLRYPLGDPSSLLEVMEYAMIKAEDPIYVKRQVLDYLDSLGRPDFDDPDEPHRLLAKFPIGLYMTTNYDPFMADALAIEGKLPKRIMSPWYLSRDEPDPSEDLEPDPAEPMVFHLHGSSQNPRSLVLGRSDYVNFLLGLTKDYRVTERALIPLSIRPNLAEQPLLFVGYRLQDWTFEVLFRGIQQMVPEGHRRRHISVQLSPLDLSDRHRRAAERYWESYYARWNISIYWGKITDFCAELRHRLRWS
ncbi:SIR2 family NAD-dependent protein deacylase [Herbidospora daliensis]|uniref:SIR2 family NAD-dependent protein deacylase n=1 Tax=Herbidospora daliensis TaxID=295585 RepID=UPI000ADEAF26|nr:SIR2 family protein [Herbidospora daliensis]